MRQIIETPFDFENLSKKHDRVFSLALCEEDIAMIEVYCDLLQFSPKPRAVSRALHRFADHSLRQGVTTIQSVYNTYNTHPVSVVEARFNGPNLTWLQLTPKAEVLLREYLAATNKTIGDLISLHIERGELDIRITLGCERKVEEMKERA